MAADGPQAVHFQGRFPLKKLAYLALLSALLALPAQAARFSDVARFAVGVNGAWLDGPGSAFPADFEASGNAALSLSPHISAVGGLAYGFSRSYFRYNAGARVTATDVDNQNFNVFLGARYRGGSTADVRPNEWEVDAGFGWRPAPDIWPRIVVGVDSGLGLQSNRSLTVAAIRYTF
jgi:hypothetical protein